MALTKAQLVDLNANELIIDLDADTSITADTDDQIDIKIAGADDFRFTANTFTALSGSSIVVPASGLTIGSTAVTSTAAELNLLDGVSGLVQADLTKLAAVDATATELNLIDGGATVGTTAVASGDGVITNDGGTMRVTNIDTFDTYLSATTKTLTNKTLTTPIIAEVDSGSTITLDATTDIVLDADGGDIFFKDDGTTFGSATNTSGNLIIKSGTTTALTFSGANVTGAGTLQGTTITATTAFVPDAANGASLGTTALEFADLYLHDGAQILWGADQDVLLTHVADAGLTLKTSATGDDTKATLTLQTGETDIAANDILGQLHFQAPDEGTGTDAILVAAGISAVAEGDFSSSSNATKLSFKTGASEAAAEKMSLSSAGVLTVSGAITSSGIVTGTAFTAGSAVLAESELELLDGLTAGTAIASKVVTTDASIDTTGQRNLTISGELDAATLDISGNADIDGTTNLDAVDIDGAVQIDATLSVGVDDTGYDVKLFGDTASAFMLWDTSADDLILSGAAGLIVPDGQFTLGSTAVTSTAAELNKLDGAGTLKQAGKETIWVPAQAMTPTDTNGCSSLQTVETTSGRPDMNVLDFDKDSDEFAQFAVAFPKSWNAGTVTFQFFWSGVAATTNVTLTLAGVAFADNDSIDTAYGTAVAVADAAQGAVEEMLVSAESGNITIAGSPGANEVAYFRIGRDVSEDNMAGDCRLHGIKLHFTTNAANDA